MTQTKNPIRRWWEGTFVPHENDPNSGLVFIGGRQEIHWTARTCRAVLIYLRDNHRWIVGVLIAIALGVYAKSR